METPIADVEEELKDRLRWLIRRTGRSDAEYAKLVRIPPAQLSKILNLHSPPPLEFVYGLTEHASGGQGGPVGADVREQVVELLLQYLKFKHPKRHELDALIVSNARLHAELSEHRERIAALTESLSEADARVAAQAGQVTALTAAGDQLRQLVADLRNRVRELQHYQAARVQELSTVTERSSFAVQEAVGLRWAAGQEYEADRLLMDAAATMDTRQLVELQTWLDGQGRHREADMLLVDIARTRSPRDLAELAEFWSDADLDHPTVTFHVACQLLRAIGGQRSREEIMELHSRWRDRPGPLGVRGWDDMFGAWIGGWRTVGELAHTLEVLALDLDANADHWKSALDALRYRYGDHAPAAEVLLILAGRRDTPWVVTMLGYYFEKHSFVVPEDFWRAVRAGTDPASQDMILRSAAEHLSDGLLEEAARYLWEAADGTDTEFLSRFLTVLVAVNEPKAVQLHAALKTKPFRDSYRFTKRREEAVQLLGALLYKAQAPAV
ncbi:hypothetical protein ACIRD3_31875 [Kitasatospora sp. NPDC093550]|uniref:hypothetical protein n=1 Tax=Kitasatospora sp. NPDC093550 TaxID=3364089 RepID=UPI0038130DEB